MAEPNLKRGHGPSDWVLYAQQMLNQALSGGMHLDMEENGVFDEEMEQEVIGFQSRHGIEQTGTVGPKTWAALHAAVNAKQRAATDDDDDEPQAPRQTHKSTGHKADDNVFHERKDEHGNTVRVYDMDDGENITVTLGAYVDWNSVVALMIEKAEKNTGEQIPYVHAAVLQFQTSSKHKIAQFARDAETFHENAHVNFPWGLLVDGLDYGLSTVFTIEGFAGWIYEKVKSVFTDSLVQDLEARANPVPGLDAKLEAGVDELNDHVNKQTVRAVDAVKSEIREYIAAQMREYQQVTNDPEWIDEMVAWFGFPHRSADNVTQPILYYLNQQFDVMIGEAQEELLRSG